jgi:N-methylhydantoinase A
VLVAQSGPRPDVLDLQRDIAVRRGLTDNHPLLRIAIDSGGTFTDCVFVRNGKLRIIKVASRPAAPADVIAEAVKLAIAQSSDQRDLDLVCGTTVGTNALLERRGGRVALLTTAGFEDVLEIARQARPKLYDLFVQKAAPLVPSALRIGVRERLAADGSFITSLTKPEVARVLQIIKKGAPDSVALCFLFSFRDPRHERRIAATLRAAGYPVSVSHEILPEFREYERISTTVINAYLVPMMSGYLRDTTTRVEALSTARSRTKINSRRANNTRAARVRIMQSNGGIISAEQAAQEPVRTILSGPAGGVIGASYAAELAGIEKSISFDMGGTSTDVALLTGELRTTSEAIVAGQPVAVPMLEIHTVGTGGGSIARFDEGGALRVGPESAGSIPGPICYGSGTKPTVTDAHAVLGHLGNEGLLGGAFSLDISRAREYMRKEIQKARTGFRTVEDFAQGIIAVANSVMEKAIRVISVERGHDPRDYTLIAFGGAGGLHACDLAAALEMRNVLVPSFPGGLSALGILRADVVKELSHTVLLLAEESLASSSPWKAILKRLESEGRRVLQTEGFAANKMRFQHSLDMRYCGQAYELNVPATGNILTGFHRAHELRYGYHNQVKKVEIVNVRCRAIGVTEKPRAETIAPRRGRAAAVPSLPLLFNGQMKKSSLYRREELCAGHTLAGPAMVMEYSATTLIPPDWRARVDKYGQLLLSRR